jgi:hypothetical protein
MTYIVKKCAFAEAEGGLVLFLIGMRINKWWKIWKWLPRMGAMPPMLKELAAHPELGRPSARAQLGIQHVSMSKYWKSAEHFRAFAPGWRLKTRRRYVSPGPPFSRRVNTQ